MPALIYCGRKWLAACDDLVIPYTIEASLRIIWLCASSVMLYLDFTDSSASCIYVRYFLYIFIGELFFTLCLCIGISLLSSRGSVLQPQKRSKIAGILYLKLFTVFFDTAIAFYLTWLLFYGPSLSPHWNIFCEAAAVCEWGYILAFIIVFFIIYNPLGSPKYWNNSDSINSIQIFKKAEKIWKLRLKFFCCCADVSEEEIYVEIATFLATFSSDIDMTPTDILAGLVVLTGKHVIERRKRNQPTTGITNSLIENKLPPLWMTAENALYYLRIAKSTYGWLAFFNTHRPWNLCSLLTPKCCTSFSNTKHGDCCNCNTSAFEKISGLSNSDVLYASFSSSIHEPAFVVTIHHDVKSIVIAIRGTGSFSDLITDINAEEMNFPEVPKLKCHRGALRSALFIHRRLHELNLLVTVFNENPSYILVLTGHSLGGCITAILGLLLRPQYPSLQCYSYAPLAAFSSEGVYKTIDFVFSVVVGDDIAPCLSVYSCKELLQQLHKCLEETQIPKYKLLTRAFKHYVKKSVKVSSKARGKSEGHENTQVEVEEPIQHAVIDMNPTHGTQLFAPGRILHLKKSESGIDFCWVNGFNLQSITISLHMMKDHQPHHIQHMLEEFKSAKEETFRTRL